MLVDSEKQILYVFGGRTILPDASQTVYSGLYAWNMLTDTWRLIRDDTTQPENSIHLKSRIGHSMILNPLTRELYIFAGQRNKDYLSDFYIYDIDNDSVFEIARDYSKLGGPEAGFTQRATIDLEYGEIYLFSGLMREKGSETVKNSFWNYSIKKNKWNKIYQNENTGTEYWSKMQATEPRPRFAHQLVYDYNTKTQYLFGGNPGETANPNLRLDDFWQLLLLRSITCNNRPSGDDVLRNARFKIRKQNFIEQCQSVDPTSALTYLQSQVAEVVNHKNTTESLQFRELTSHLFTWKRLSTNSDSLTKDPNNSGIWYL
jgi:hypothetical protein